MENYDARLRQAAVCSELEQLGYLIGLPTPACVHVVCFVPHVAPDRVDHSNWLPLIEMKCQQVSPVLCRSYRQKAEFGAIYSVKHTHSSFHVYTHIHTLQFRCVSTN